MQISRQVRISTGALAAMLALRGAQGAVAGAGMNPERLFPGAVFAPSVPTQEQATGVRPGSRPLRHDELVRYFRALEAASPRAKLIEYSRSWEDRPLYYLAVGDEATVARLDAFREEHARAVDPRTAAPSGGSTGTKPVAWMAYGIHGDELSSSDAAAALAYWLVAGEDERAKSLRRDILILIDPCENPDGRERYLSQTTSFAHAAQNPDTEDLSHTSVWPWGRGNHYLFDLNRDWFSMVQPESARSEVIARWTPELMVDSHEMGADDSYLFSPPRHPFNPFLPPYTLKWWDRFAADQAQALDRRGYGYYTRDWNEEFFPGYGSSWAAYLGAIGILYEMSSTDGTLVRQRAGTTRTFAEAVEHHVASSVANLISLADNRAEIGADFVKARREAVRLGTQGPLGAWILVPGKDPERANDLARLLRRQGIEVVRSASAAKVSGLRDARTGKTSSSELPAGTYMVPLDQPAAPLARVLLDPHVPMAPEFLREEREYLERGKGTRLYDTTAWSLPLLHGVSAYWTAKRPAADWSAGDAALPEGNVDGTESGFAWILDGTSDRAAFALADLLQQGIAVRLAEKPFSVTGQSFPAGSALVQREGNPTDLRSRLRAIAGRRRVEFHATPTAKAEMGPDLGGHDFHSLVAPKVAILTGSAVSPASYGALWHLLDTEANLRFAGIDASRFGQADLSRFNVLVFPSSFGGGAAYRHLLGDAGLDRLKRWIEAGGTVIGIGSGAEFLADKDVKLGRARMRRQALDRFPPVVLGAGPMQAESGGPFRAVGVRAPDAEGKDGGKEGGKDSGKDKSSGYGSGRSGENTSGSSSGASGGSDATDSSGSTRAGAAAKNKDATGATAVGGPSAYEIAPWIGPGARPFVPGTAVAVDLKPQSLAQWLKPFLPPGKDKPDPDELERGDERLRRFAPRGALLRAELDSDDWLNWGLPSSLDVWVAADDTLVAEPPVHVAARFADLASLHLGGLLWPEAAGRIAKTAYCTREGLGRGQIILFLDEPVYRGWTLGTRRLFMNALLYGPGMGTSWSSPW